MKRGFGFRAGTLFLMFNAKQNPTAGTDLAVEISERSDKRPEGFLVAGGKYQQIAVMAPDAYLTAKLNRFAVDMCASGRTSSYRGILRTKRLYDHIILDKSGNEFHPGTCLCERSAGMNDREVEKSVSYRRFRSDEYIVAVLRGIACRHYERFQPE